MRTLCPLVCFFFFARKREPRSGVKNVPYVKENVNVRFAGGAVKIVVLHTE